jgi:hypothetical protein
MREVLIVRFVSGPLDDDFSIAIIRFIIFLKIMRTELAGIASHGSTAPGRGRTYRVSMQVASFVRLPSRMNLILLPNRIRDTNINTGHRV